MPTTAAIAELYKPESSDPFLALLTIDHADLTVPIRVVCNNEDVASRGEEFIAFPFGFTLPDDKEDAPPGASLTISNVSREIGQAIRSIVGPPTVLIEVVRASDPDTVELVSPVFLLRSVRYDAQQVTGVLMVEDLTREPFPALKFTPGPFPAVF